MYCVEGALGVCLYACVSAYSRLRDRMPLFFSLVSPSQLETSSQCEAVPRDSGAALLGPGQRSTRAGYLLLTEEGKGRGDEKGDESKGLALYEVG